MLLTNRKLQIVYQQFFQEFVTECPAASKFSSASFMTDLEHAIANAGKVVWKDSTWKLCFFHVKMNATEKMHELSAPKQIVKQLKDLLTDVKNYISALFFI